MCEVVEKYAQTKAEAAAKAAAEAAAKTAAKNEAKKIAMLMLEHGDEDEYISKVTSLTLDEIGEIKENGNL